MSNLFDGINAAMNSTPSDFLEARDKYKTDLQNKIDETWWMASDNYEIQIENTMGARDFTPIICRVNHAIEPKTGLNLGDDFKELKFFNLDSPVTMGYRFIFDDSWWMVVNSDNYHYITKSVIVRRCNNLLKYYRNGHLVEEPCIIEYATKYSNVYYNNLVEIPQGTIEVICQNNENTQPVQYNNRFIFGKEVYKVKTIKDYLRQKTFVDKSNPLVQFSMYVDTKSPNDNFELGIADYYNYNKNESPDPPINPGFEITVSPTLDNILIGETITYTCTLYKDGVKGDETFTFTPKNVPSKNFTLNVIDGNSFSITNIEPYFENPLNIVCSASDGVNQKELTIYLKGLY